MKRLHRLLRFAAPVLALTTLAGTSSATWSIVLVNHATGEVAVTAATCLPGTNIKKIVPVVWVGVGAAAAQSAGDVTGENRVIIRDGLFNRETPQAILDELRFGAGTAPNQRQYGIASFDGAPVTFTGGQAGDAQIGVVGTVGDISYAIQGNLLAGDEVVYQTELALLATEGDIGQKMVAAMEAGRDFGGDGRCSCNGNNADQCGSPPVDGFEKSAHVISFHIARIGDENGGCNAGGCAKGTYYCNLKFIGNFSNPDPVTKLRQLYNGWRADRSGVPDHILSEVTSTTESMPADGFSTMQMTVKLVDLDGVPLTTGGAIVEVTPQTEAEGAAPVTVTDVVDNEDGTYTVEIEAGVVPGETELVITADDGFKKVTLYPFPKVKVDEVTPLHVGYGQVSSSAGATVPFTVNDPQGAGSMYLILGSASGTDPGTQIGDLFLPLNVDDLTFRTLRAAGGRYLPESIGVLDAAGNAQGYFDAPPGLMRNVIGTRLDWAAVVFDDEFRATNAVGFEVLP